VRRQPPATFALTLESRSGDAARFRLTGVAGFATAKALLARGAAEFAGYPRVDVDLSGVASADSAGLAVLLTWVEQARSAQRQLNYTALPAQLSAIARVCAVEELLRAAAAPSGA
jgi:phospholipid transport system transporter-binding protein